MDWIEKEIISIYFFPIDLDFLFDIYFLFLQFIFHFFQTFTFHNFIYTSYYTDDKFK